MLYRAFPSAVPALGDHFLETNILRIPAQVTWPLARTQETKCRIFPQSSVSAGIVLMEFVVKCGIYQKLMSSYNDISQDENLMNTKYIICIVINLL
jgi:hypothetical protein